MFAAPLPIDDLLAPIPGDNPAGESVPFAVRAEMEEARKEVDPDDFAADDPMRPTETKRADWPAIARLAMQTLTESSKDLLVAARLTEALTKQHGYAGLAEGLVLLRRLLDECWDRLHPSIEDGDLEVRAGPFNWLGDDGRGARFPHTIRTVPLFQGEKGWYNLRDWRQAQDGKGKVGRDDLDKAVAAASREHCQKLFDDLTRAQGEMMQLTQTLNARLGREAPGLTDLRNALMEAYLFAKQVLDRKGPAPGADEGDAPASEGNGETSGGVAKPARAMATREDIYARLTEAADLLAKLEPHSPVPYLIRRAVELGSLPFPQMIKALIREDHSQAINEMNRELGIREPS